MYPINEPAVNGATVIANITFKESSIILLIDDKLTAFVTNPAKGLAGKIRAGVVAVPIEITLAPDEVKEAVHLTVINASVQLAGNCTPVFILPTAPPSLLKEYKKD